MQSRERLLAAWNGEPTDHIPLTFQCFGNQVPEHLRWTVSENGRLRKVSRWYTKRMEHLHAPPVDWTLEDEFQRVRTWLSLGADDLVDVSVPWSTDPAVAWTDLRVEPDESSENPVLVREYATPGGGLRHRVRQTGEELGEGWVVQPDVVRLFDDFNIPRAVEHAVSSPEDVNTIRYLYAPPDSGAVQWMDDRMAPVAAFAREQEVAVQAWAAFGMDAVVWLCGTEGAIFLAMDHPEAFGELMDIITETDLARVELAARSQEIDLIVERGWYSSTDFWSPALIDRFLVGHVSRLADLCHSRGKKFCYTVTTGVEIIGPKLADAGVDVLYWVDPLLDQVSLKDAAQLLGSRMCLVGGANSITLASRDRNSIEAEVERAVRDLGPTGRFILHPVDALFPDTPWEGVEELFKAWKKHRGQASP